MLISYQGSVDEFLSLRRSIWPDSYFYHPNFSEQRLDIAMSITDSRHNQWVAPAMCRSVIGLDKSNPQILSENLEYDIMRTPLTSSLFYSMAKQVGTAWRRRTAREWAAVTHDNVKYAADVRDLNMCVCSQYCASIYQRMTPLLSLISASLRARINLKYIRSDEIIPKKVATVVSESEYSIFVWLSCLYEAGVDLLLYGRMEQKCLQGCGFRPQGLRTDYESTCPYYEVHLIGFEYGGLPKDWRFWWSEPTDEFSGEFWCLIESKHQEVVINLPGAWVD